jgi:hypothetical protein
MLIIKADYKSNYGRRIILENKIKIHSKIQQNQQQQKITPNLLGV